jgi:hypothetical protein
LLLRVPQHTSAVYWELCETIQVGVAAVGGGMLQCMWMEL